MDGSKSYNVNFFKPSTPFLRENIRAIVIGLVIWAVATYGFQILLKVIETPTPEPIYVAYKEAAPKLAEGTASPEEKVIIARTYLRLLGKSAALLGNEELKIAFTSTINDLLSEAEKKTLATVAAESAGNPKVNVDFIYTALGITDKPNMKAAVPYALTQISPDRQAMVPAGLIPVMDKFFIHNQSVLTDTIVLGFPFHYLYTALFLLTLFVVICLVYCQVIDKLMKKYDLESTYE